MAPKELIKTGLNKVGVNVTRAPAPHLLAHHLRNFIRDNDVNLVLDVGAHHGQFSTVLRQEVGYRGAIVSFEPSEASFDVLRGRMAADPAWRGFHFGLSDSDGAATLNTFEAGDFNSLLELSPQLAALYEVDTSKSSTETIQLHQIDTVWDDIVRDMPDPRVLMKIDTQGHDAAVFRGAVEHLDYVLGIQSELPAVEIYDGMLSMPEALKLYRSHGYVPIGFFPVTFLGQLGFITEFDVILKRLSAEVVAAQAVKSSAESYR